MLELEKVAFSYRRKTIFTDVNIHWPVGTIGGILGPNGSGKTTLLKLIAGLLNPVSGKITVMDKIPFARSVNSLRQLFFLMDEFELPHVRIGKLSAIYGSCYPDFCNATFKEHLSDFKLSANYHLDDISFGQVKKAWISFALACNTKLLLMDEPTNGLDIESKATLRQKLAAQLNSDTCILISTHQIRDLELLLDHITIINDGYIICHEPLALQQQYGKNESLEERYLKLLNTTAPL